MSYTGWDPPGPTVVLCTSVGNYRRIDPAMNQTPRVINNWIELKVPLAGGNGWATADVGAFNLKNVNWVEVHVDPLKNAGTGNIQVWLDGLKFY